MVVPSWAVTTTVMVLLPTLRLIACEALPLATAVPLTVMVAPAPAAVGVTVMLVALFDTCRCRSWWLLANTGIECALAGRSRLSGRHCELPHG